MEKKRGKLGGVQIQCHFFTNLAQIWLNFLIPSDPNSIKERDPSGGLSWHEGTGFTGVYVYDL